MARIQPASVSESWKTGSLSPALSAADITKLLHGVEPAEDFDEAKVTTQWEFTVDGEPCSIWDYKGVRWSTFGPDHALAAVFGAAYRPF